MTSKNGLIRTLFEESWLWVINLALRTPGGRGVGSMQTTVEKGEGGVKNWQNFADVFYGWPLTFISIHYTIYIILWKEMLIICTINTNTTLLLKIVIN